MNYSSLFSSILIYSSVSAAIVCLLTITTVLVLTARAEALPQHQRRPWIVASAALAGAGFSLSHLVALPGLLPGSISELDPTRSLFAILFGVAIIGGFLGVAIAADKHRIRTAAAAASGLGIGAMHLAAINALQNSIVSLNWLATASGMVFSAIAFALLFSLAPERRWQVRSGLLLALGFCAPYAATFGSATLVQVSNEGAAITVPGTLNGYTLFGALACCGIAILISRENARIQAYVQSIKSAQARQYRELSAALHHMSNGLILVASDSIIGLHNERVCELLHLEPGDVAIGMPLAEFLANAGQRLGWDDARVKRVLDNHYMWMSQEDEMRLEHHYDDGTILRICCRPMPDGGAILTYDDVSEERAAQAEMTHLAYHDALTGLPNRRSFCEAVDRLLATTPQVGVLMLDLDRFKAVNDTLGHAVGDALLVQSAARLRETCRDNDLIFRLGGDELAILLQPKKRDDGDELGQRIVAAFSTPFMVDGHTINIGCSAGYAVSGADENSGVLMQKADLALYCAKAQGRNCAVRYETGMMEKAIARQRIEADLIRGLENGEFELHYQPLYLLPDQKLAGFEALIRWNHPERGRVAPLDFVPLAEENGMITKIGSWVLDEACRQAALWPGHLHVAVNISPVQMRSPGLVTEVLQALQTHGVEPNRLELELTETAMVEDGQQIAQTLQTLREIGVRIAMDDFGTGYSSLAHLRDFKLDRIKIDRSFINIEDDAVGALAVVRAVTSMANDLSIQTTAEGVETDEQLTRLIALGCNTAQGYFLGKPMDSATATAIVHEWSETNVVPMLRSSGSMNRFGLTEA
ncbi:EAL domain-containing protein [uncultured Jannaschia sp.]|uniref:putative bifunctional diguanylate cyclase/phosphodiesterase n=1 Tax=uncultured Jannaschia sp. TaxID=293347 RepID=UPI002627E4C5|nr:EAL domain-containing protein [uncultured Jannaschia sp.]